MISLKSRCLFVLATCLLSGLIAFDAPAARAERLANGIKLPAHWPPKAQPFNGEPMPVPYLKHPPRVLPIDLGRQLFVDDFLIESTTLQRKFHQPKYDEHSPVLKPEKPWEIKLPNPQAKNKKARAGSAFAGAYSDGVWFDPARGKFMMWYRAEGRATCLAYSEDGVHWTKPDLDLEPGTNIVLRSVRDSSTVILDQQTTDPRQRFKLFEARYKNKNFEIGYHVSADGVHWSKELLHSGPSWDRSTMFWNPFRQVWVASVRGHNSMKPDPVNRLRNYHEGKTVAEALDWKQHTDQVAKGNTLPNDLRRWVAADRLDPHHPDPRFHDEAPQLYNLDVFPYESLMVGLFTIWQGPQNEVCEELGIMKRNEVLVGFSRDGFHWDRANRNVFLPVSKNKAAWNAYNVQSVGGGCVLVGDQLYFYCTGRTLTPTRSISTGLAKLRRDGFASMDVRNSNTDDKNAGDKNAGDKNAGDKNTNDKRANDSNTNNANNTNTGGTLTTRPLRFTGGHLFVNANTHAGRLQVEVLDQAGKVLPGFSKQACNPVSGDHTKAAVTWKSPAQLSQFSGKTVRFRFHLSSGSLYSFWVASTDQGTSGGYVAAGGPAYPGPRDE